MIKALITVFFLALPVMTFASPGSDREIFDFLNSCRYEQNTAFVKSPSSSASYTVGKVNGQYIINVSIQLRYAAYFSSEEMQEAKQLLEGVKDWITRYYKQYGLNLNIHFEHAAFNRASSNPHPTPADQSFVVYIRRDTGSHMKKSYWGVNRHWDMDARARIIAHEFSHLLHLKDEYHTVLGAKTREEAASYENDSLMKNVDHPNPKLYVRHFKQILSPLCDEPDVLRLAQDSTSAINSSH